MKKLLVTAIGAAAALGAYAEYTNAQRFEGMGRGETTVSALGTNWSEKPNSTNTYTIVEMVSGGQVINHPDAFKNETDPSNALSVKTTFGKPLSYNVIPGGTATNLESNLYFDSLVKFTVCEDTPTETYDGAKIVMWLQEQYDGGENITGTNLMVRAGYLTDGGVVATNYTCGNTIAGDFADKWHRVTIKAMPTISTAATVPGFAIFIDGGPNTMEVSSDDAKWDVAPALTEAAAHYGQTKLFPSLIQNSDDPAKSTLTCASFDGTGTLNDMVFTSKVPGFTEAEDYVAPKANVTIGETTTECTTFDEVLDLVNNLSEGQTATVMLMKGLTMEAPITFEGEGTIILDFAGFVLTNEVADAVITNAAVSLIVTNSVGNGGIYSSVSDGEAIHQTADGAIAIAGGNFWADNAITVDGGYMGEAKFISGGAFADNMGLVDRLVDGKAFADDTNPTTGLYDVIDYVPPTYTVKFISGEGSATNEYTDVVEGTEQPVPVPAAVVGKSFSAWDPAIAGATVTVTADATYTALYTNNMYTITFVIGESSSSVQKEYGSTIDSVPEIPIRAGYTGAWDNDPAGDTVTGDKTYTYTYSAETYTITFVNEIGTDPASVNYTIESGEIALPTATTENTGVEFDGWTNATITAAITNFTPTAENVGSFTLYAAWKAIGPVTPTIDPAAPAVVEVTAATKQAAIDAVAVPAPAGSGIDTPEELAAYKDLFVIEATNKGGDAWDVALTGIKESVKTDVSEDAVDVLTSATGTGTVDVPAGLYYRITRYTAIGTAVVEIPATGLSTGSGVSVDKPGDTQGFIKVEMSTVPFD